MQYPCILPGLFSIKESSFLKRFAPLTRRQLAEKSVAFIFETAFAFAVPEAVMPGIGAALGSQKIIPGAKPLIEGVINIFKTEESLIGNSVKFEKAKRMATPVTSIFAEAGTYIQKRIETIKEQINNVKNMLLKDPEFMTSLIPGKTAGEKVKNFFRGLRKKGLKIVAEAEGGSLKMDFDVWAEKEYEKTKKFGNTFEKTQKTNINMKGFEEGIGEKNVFGGEWKNLDKSKIIQELENLNDNKIKHILEGSKNSNHKWENLVSDKNWKDIKKIMQEVMETGRDEPYKSTAWSKIKIINGEEVEVVYIEADGIIKISNAWIR